MNSQQSRAPPCDKLRPLPVFLFDAGLVEAFRGDEDPGKILQAVAVFVAGGDARDRGAQQCTAEMQVCLKFLWEEVMPVSEQLKELSRKVTAPSAFLELEQPRDAQWLARLLPSTDPFRHTRRIERRLNQLGEHPLLPFSDLTWRGAEPFLCGWDPSERIKK